MPTTTRLYYTVYRHIVAKKSPTLLPTARNPACGIRRKTDCTHKRRCWHGYSGRQGEKSARNKGRGGATPARPPLTELNAVPPLPMKSNGYEGATISTLVTAWA